jgi:uncharacterized membrane protein YkvA (DUF1232 family)
MILRIFVGCIATLAITWLLTVVAFIAIRPRGQSVRELAALFPNTLHLLRGLAADPGVSRGVRWRLLIAIAYNVQPFTLIPDFVPVIGLADNLVVTCWALRSAIRTAGPEAVHRHWPGTADQLTTLYRIGHLGPTPASQYGDAPKVS